jgi:hypothetical protein
MGNFIRKHKVGLILFAAITMLYILSVALSVQAYEPSVPMDEPVHGYQTETLVERLIEKMEELVEKQNEVSHWLLAILGFQAGLLVMAIFAIAWGR